ncbi:MAG TPA: transglycosylase domain-containing protein, partial [Aggregatilineales bacterium]|nr:transglycosylase domain-containing protein [Aggregatilineales bacterium]
MKATANVVRRRRARRAAELKKRSGRNHRQGLFIIAGIVVALVLLAGTTAALAVGVYIYYARDLPNPDDIVKAHQQFETTLLYDRTGKTVLYQVLDPSGGDRQSVALGDIPLDLRNATIVSEDRSFYQNPGFDVRGMLRALSLAVQGQSIQGASTITQQLVKNVLLAPEGRAPNTPDRKIREIILSAEIARRYGKDQILEWYLNNNFYGNLAYGVATAAKVYFGKRVQDLTLGEAAMLAAIPQNPELNPIDAPIAARQRQAVVLDSMVESGYLTVDQATEAKSQVIQIQPNTE